MVRPSSVARMWHYLHTPRNVGSAKKVALNRCLEVNLDFVGRPLRVGGPSNQIGTFLLPISGTLCSKFGAKLVTLLTDPARPLGIAGRTVRCAVDEVQMASTFESVRPSVRPFFRSISPPSPPFSSLSLSSLVTFAKWIKRREMFAL